MVKRITQKDRVRRKLEVDGFIDNFWCIEQKVSIRLGAIIHDLRQEGMEIDGGYIEGTKNFRYELTNRKPRIVGWDTSTGVAKPIWQ